MGSFGALGDGIGDLVLLGDVPPTGDTDFGLPGDPPTDTGTGLGAGVLLPTLDDESGESQIWILQCLTLSGLPELADPDDGLAPPPPLLLCRNPCKL